MCLLDADAVGHNPSNENRNLLRGSLNTRCLHSVACACLPSDSTGAQRDMLAGRVESYMAPSWLLQE